MTFVVMVIVWVISGCLFNLGIEAALRGNVDNTVWGRFLFEVTGEQLATTLVSIFVLFWGFLAIVSFIGMIVAPFVVPAIIFRKH